MGIVRYSSVHQHAASCLPRANRFCISEMGGGGGGEGGEVGITWVILPSYHLCTPCHDDWTGKSFH